MKTPLYRLFLPIIILCTITSCTHQPDLTPGAINLLATYNKILSKTDTCSLPHHSKIYSVSADMPAIDYMQPNGKDSLVTYTATFNTGYPNAIFTNWECSKSGYLNNTICPPKIIHFPYTYDTLETKAPYLAKFIEVDALQKLKPDVIALTSANDKLPFVSLADVVSITSYHLEARKEFIDANYHARYIDPTAELGIVCDLKLKSGAIKHCYILTDYLGTMHWKNPMH